MLAGEVQALPIAAYAMLQASTVARNDIPMTIPERMSFFNASIFERWLFSASMDDIEF